MSDSLRSIGSRREGLRAAATYARLAVFAAACAVYALLRFALFGRFRRPQGARRTTG